MPSLHLYKIVEVLHEHTPRTEIQTTLRHPLPHLQRGHRAGGPMPALSPSVRGADSGCQSPAELELGGAGSTAVICPVPGSLRPLRLTGFPLIPDVLMTQPGAPRPDRTREQPGRPQMLPLPVISSTGLRCPGVRRLLCPPPEPCARGWPDSAGRSTPQESACLTSSQVMLEPLAQGGSGTRAEAESPQTCPAALPLATALVTKGPDPLSHGNWTRS